MKNPHGVEPTRYMKREDSDSAINCDPRYGPIFGCDIGIRDNCNKNGGWTCYGNNYKSSYECNNSLINSPVGRFHP